MGKKFLNIYLNILNEQKSPVTFTPEALLRDAMKRCYWCFEKSGTYFQYTINDILKICRTELSIYEDFQKFLSNNKDDFSLNIFYFKSIKYIPNVLDRVGYFSPTCTYKFSFDIVKKSVYQYFQDTEKEACNFNSIDVCPELGCFIGINGEKVKNYKDFEKNLDHELNYYFEKMKKFPKKLNNDLKGTDEIAEVLMKFYGKDFFNNQNISVNILHHLLDENEFRSMCSDVFYGIIKYNLNHVKEITYREFMRYLDKENLFNAPIELQDVILFSWIVLKLSEERFNILNNGLISAFKEKKNIFQKIFLKIRDIFRNIICEKFK